MADSPKKPVGRQKGGIARRDALSPEQLKAQAQRAAAVRWGKPLIAIKKGNFKEHFGIDVECYVLDDATRTAVISQTGMAKAIGLSARGNALPRFLASQAMSEFVSAELSQKFQNPLRFQWGTGGAEQPPADINGYDATHLIDLCQAILKANQAGRLKSQQDEVAKQAAIVVSASAKSGIKGLVYALAGYSPTANEVIEAFKRYVQEEAKKYEKEFPPELYINWHRLYEIPVLEKGRSWHFKHLTVKHIYYPLAKSSGKILELVRAHKAAGGDRQAKLFQFLNEVGARALRMQIGRVLEMTDSSKSKQEYEAKIVERFGGQRELDLLPIENN